MVLTRLTRVGFAPIALVEPLSCRSVTLELLSLPRVPCFQTESQSTWEYLYPFRKGIHLNQRGEVQKMLQLQFRMQKKEASE